MPIGRELILRLAMAAGLAVASVAAGQHVPSPSTYHQGADAVDMTGLDKNSDRMISRQEAQHHERLTRQFERLDQNRDGQLDQGEFAAFEAQASGETGATQGRPAAPEPGSVDNGR